MLKRLLPLCAAVALLFGLFQPGPSVGAESVQSMQPEVCATVTFVSGAPVLAGAAAVQQPLSAGQALYPGSSVQTDSVSRVELALTGGGIVRLAEETTLELGAGAADAGQPGPGLQVLLLKGGMWVNLSNRLPGSPPQILAAGAMFSGPRSVFRAIVFADGAAEVKAYSGQVTASGPFEIKKENSRFSLGARPGGEEGTLEPWRHQITPYRKVLVPASGDVSQPFRFAAKSDLTDWVRWNQQRDAEN